MRTESKGMLLGFLGVTAFGLTLPVTRVVVADLDPMFVGFGRAVVAAMVAAAWLAVFKSRLPNKTQWRKLLVVSGGVVVGFPLLSAWAMQTLHGSHGAVVLGVLPLATALASMLVSDERPSNGFWLSSLAGSAIVVGYSVGSSGLQLGDLALLGAVVSAAVGYAVGGQLAKELGGGTVVCWALVLALPAVAVPALLTAPDSFDAISPGIWGGFLYLALVSQLFGFFLWNAGLAIGGIARVSQTQLMQPFVTIAASALLLGETIDPMTLIFAFLVVSLVAVGRAMPITSASRSAAVTSTYSQSKAK